MMIRTRHLKMAARFAAHRFRPLHPFEVQALLLNACNLKCTYCRCPDLKSALMTTEQWQVTIRGLAALGTMRIKFQGGEPTLYPGFRELCVETRRAGILTAVITNGVKVAAQPELLDDLDEMVVSLDSATPEIHDRHRGAGTHARAVQAIDHARQRGLPTYVVMVVNRDNLQELEALLDFCEARGAGMHAQPVLFGRRAFDDAARHLELTPEQMRTMHMRLAEWKRQGRKLMFSASSYQGAAAWPDHTVLTTRSDGPSPCVAGKSYIHIEPNGDVWPCHQHGAEFTPRNIVRDGLEAALQHVQQHNCGDCFTVYLNERKALFGLRPAALWEVVRRG
jgi:MoaA/NifB/PqqE/SkfB family radical SAM enzyme